MKISVYIIAYNEAEKIQDCINSVLWADEIIVADSYSTDGTTEIAQKLGAKVIHIPFKGYGDLRNQAIAKCKGDWVFSLDSDERCTTEVRDEILGLIDNAPLDIYRVPRKNFFMELVHEGYISHSDKEVGVIKNIIWQFPFKNTEEVIDKANRYSTLGVQKLQDKGKTSSIFKAFLHGFWSFIKHYIFKLGFLDGGPGFVIAFGNFEGTFYRYIKLIEAQENWKTPNINPIHKIQQ